MELLPDKVLAIPQESTDCVIKQAECRRIEYRAVGRSGTEINIKLGDDAANKVEVNM